MIKRKLIIGDLTVGGEPPPTPPKTSTPQHTRPDWIDHVPVEITAICPICSTGLASAVELTSHLRRFHGRGLIP